MRAYLRERRLLLVFDNFELDKTTLAPGGWQIGDWSYPAK